MKLLHSVLLMVLLIAACSPRAVAPAVTPSKGEMPAGGAETSIFDDPATVTTPASKPGLPPRPTPSGPSLDFPTCEPDPVPPLVLEPLPAPAVPSADMEFPPGPSLRSLAEQRGLYIGSAAAPHLFDQPGYGPLLAGQFNLLATENALKWEIVHPEADRYNFTQADALVAFARANRMAVYAHPLVWELQQPAWLMETDRSRDEWIGILCRHIKTIVSRYRGQMLVWNVINEPFQNNGMLRDTLWMRVIGPEYIAMAFTWARQADPEAVLTLNEHFAEGLNAKSQAVYALLQGLLEAGIPIDGVGLQMHIWLWGPPSRSALAENLRRLNALGLQAHITEMDVRLQYTSDSPAEELAAQADHYRQVLSVCLEAVSCNVFVVWGLTDRYSWIPAYTGTPDAPLLFDFNGRPKPAFEAVRDELK